MQITSPCITLSQRRDGPRLITQSTENRMAKITHHRVAKAARQTLPLALLSLTLASGAPTSIQAEMSIPTSKVSTKPAAPVSSPAPVAPRPSVKEQPAIADTLLKQAPGLTADALRLALKAAENAAAAGLVTRRELLTVIDYSLPSDKPRLFVFDLEQEKLLFHELVAHGVNSGGNLTTRFSNVENSRATSLGLFVTAGTYFGSNGYSLRLRGLDQGFNDQALARAIVMHGAPYVSESTIKSLGRLGRSWGCPAVPAKVSKKIIDQLKGGSPIFAYYPDPAWLKASKFLRGESARS